MPVHVTDVGLIILEIVGKDFQVSRSTHNPAVIISSLEAPIGPTTPGFNDGGTVRFIMYSCQLMNVWTIIL